MMEKYRRLQADRRRWGRVFKAEAAVSVLMLAAAIWGGIEQLSLVAAGFSALAIIMAGQSAEAWSRWQVYVSQCREMEKRDETRPG